MTRFKPTEEQQAVIDATRTETSSSLMIRAGAGCTKSTTLEMAAPGVKVPALAMAFNKAIAVALQPKMPSNFTVKTLNGLGHGAWARANPGAKIELDDKKLGKLVSQSAADHKVKLSSDQWDAVRQLVNKAMLAGITPGDIGRPIILDSKENWKALADELWISDDEFEMLQGLAWYALNESIKLAKRGVISFDDQVYCSVCLGGLFPRYPVIFVDEAQDLSLLNHKMIELTLHRDGRLIVVGDPKQAIYAWRGASSNSMELIRGLRPKWKDLPLMTTFRCPKVVVARQQWHVPGFKAAPGNPEGKFKQMRSLQADSLTYNPDQLQSPLGWKWKEISDEADELGNGKGITILSRANAPLMSMAFKLIRRRVGVKMLGREIGKGLISLTNKLAPEDSTSALNLAAKLTEWSDHECDLARANGQDEKVDGINDRTESIRAVLSDAEVKDAGQCRAVLQMLFSRTEGQVTLSSIHKFKGLESDLVVHLDPWRIPSRWAKDAQKRGDDAPMEQEFNLGYVGETRTRHTLLNANLEDLDNER